jgi:hypothetical protein
MNQVAEWPSGADGDVFRRLASRNFDFSRQYSIEFTVDFTKWPPSRAALEALRAAFPNAAVHENSDKRSGYVLFVLSEKLSYEYVIRIQADATRIAAPFNGYCESWGILH